MVRAAKYFIIGCCLVGAVILIAPNFKRVDPGMGNYCVNNLRQIQSAKEQWMLEWGKTTNDVPTWADLNPYMGRTGDAKSEIHCPAGGIYTLRSVGEKPTCSIGGPSHTLQ